MLDWTVFEREIDSTPKNLEVLNSVVDRRQRQDEVAGSGGAIADEEMPRTQGATGTKTSLGFFTGHISVIPRKADDLGDE